MTTSKNKGSSPVKVVAAVVAVLLVTGGSLVVYLAERAQGQTQVRIGDENSPDRVDIGVYVQKVDPVTKELVAQLEIAPQGALADEAGDPRQDLTVFTNGIKGDTLQFKAGKSAPVADLRMAMNGGVITDYPFDSYQIDLGFSAETADGPVPVSVTFGNGDSFFRLKPENVQSEQNALLLTTRAVRSTGTFAFALFIMVFMWLLSLAAVVAAVFAVGGRRGLLWPSMSFMGALLFALVPLRNAVPGQPPIGSVVDFTAFFIAEALISLSLIITVIAGFRVERANEKKEKQGAQPPPSPMVTVPTMTQLPPPVPYPPSHRGAGVPR